MKTIASVLFALGVLGFFISSCSKNNARPITPVATTTLSLLQNKWHFISATVYPTVDLAGSSPFGYYAGANEYYDFRADGNIYAYAGGVFDTAGYKLLSNDSTMYVYDHKNGVPAIIPDTATIRSITNNSLIFWSRNPAGDYGKFSFSR